MPAVTVPRPKGHGTASRRTVKRSWRRADNWTPHAHLVSTATNPCQQPLR